MPMRFMLTNPLSTRAGLLGPNIAASGRRRPHPRSWLYDKRAVPAKPTGNPCGSNAVLLHSAGKKRVRRTKFRP